MNRRDILRDKLRSVTAQRDALLVACQEIRRYYSDPKILGPISAVGTMADKKRWAWRLLEDAIATAEGKKTP